METIDLSYSGLIIIYALMAIPFIIFFNTGVDLIKTTVIALVRMTIQLTLVGLYLGVLFELNSLLLNITWLVVMLLVANVNIIGSAGLKLRYFFIPAFIGVAVGTGVVVAVFVFIVIQPDPLYDARYLIPIAGMILGNCLKGNVMALERFYYSIHKNEKEFSTYLFMGARLNEAVRPYFKAALKAASSPHVATMATIGIVSLPGMMTGQILGGSFPVVAIKYQIAIMISIFTAMSLSAYLNIRLSLKAGFDDFQNLRREVLK
ncbi:MAG TPA: ABC transporter permease [Chitinispirillaceae bacterium]|nr:ABC transporter permease [Chitinispirillaceae bacterium]